MICLCESGLPQLNYGKCSTWFRTVVDVLPIQKKGSDGVENFISTLSIPVAESVFEGMFWNADASKRLHMINGIKDWTPAMGDAAVKTWADGSTTKIRNGQLSASFVVPKTSPLYAHAIQSLECGATPAYFRDSNNQIMGYANPNDIATDNKLYPVPVDRWEVVAMPFGSDTEVAMATVTVYFPRTLELDHLIILEASEHELSATDNYELQQATLASGAAATTTSITVKVTSNTGGILGANQPVTGLGVASFDIKEGASTIAILTATETVPGTYVLTFTAQTPADVLVTTLTGITGYTADAVSITIP